MVYYDGKKKEMFFQLFLMFTLLLLCIVTIYPFMNLLVKSFSTGKAMVGKVVTIFPIKPTLQNYQILFVDPLLGSGLYISVMRTVIGTILHIITVALAAYAISKKQLKGFKLIVLFFVIPMYFGGGLLPSFIIIAKLGLMQSFWVYIFPLMFSPYHLLIMTTYFRQLPASFEESAKIDGASDLVVFFRIIVPMSASVIAAIALFVAVMQWNSWFDATLYVRNTRLWPLQQTLQMILREAQGLTITKKAEYGITQSADVHFTLQSVRSATMMFTIIPILIVYPFLQKHFVKGVMIGGLKG